MPSLINATTTAGVAVSGDNSGVLALQTNNGTTAVTIDTSQNVGIGTSSPAVKLDVLSPSAQTVASFGHPSTSTTANNGGAVLRVQNTSSTNGNMQSLAFTNASGATTSIILGYNTNQSTNEGFMTFGTRNSGGTFGERMRIGSDGKVGIGTTNLSGDFTVSNGGANGFEINPTEGSGASNKVNSYNRSTSAYTTLQFDALDFRVATGSSATERMRILSGGNVLIGATSLYNSERVRIYTDSNANDYALYAANMSGSGYHGMRSEIATAGNNTSTWHFAGVTSGVNAYYLYGNGTTSYSSDARLKKNIETSRSGYLEDLAKLRVVKYNWLNDEDNTPKELGLIAQEVEQVFPNLIQEHELEGVGIRKNIKHSVMEFILIKAVQELKAIVDAQAAEIAALKGVK